MRLARLTCCSASARVEAREDTPPSSRLLTEGGAATPPTSRLGRMAAVGGGEAVL